MTSADVALEPVAQRPGIRQHLDHVLARGRAAEPGLKAEVLVDVQVLMAQQPPPRMVLGKACRHSLEGLCTELVTGPLKPGDDRRQRRARGFARDLLSILRELRGRELITSCGDGQPPRIEGDVATGAFESGMARDVGLVGRFVLRKANVTVGAKDLTRPVVLLERLEKSDHRAAHRLFIRLAVGLEIALCVVELEADEKSLSLFGPSTEWACHRPQSKAWR